MRLFCIPFAGGSARAYADWNEHLTPDIELVPLDPPDRSGRSHGPPPADVADLVEILNRRIIGRGTDEPYALYGHSFGGIVAYECTRRLIGQGIRPPRRLFVSGCQPPQRRPRFGTIHTYPDQAFMGVLAAMGGVPPELLHEADALDFFADRIRHDYRLYERYRHRPAGRPLSCPITVITGDEDPGTTPHDVHDWQQLTSARATGIELAGAGHYFLSEHAATLTDHIAAALLSQVQEPAEPMPTTDFLKATQDLPDAVTVLTTSTVEGSSALRVDAACVLSISPPLLLFTVDRADHQHEALTTQSRFLANLLTSSPNQVPTTDLLPPRELGLPALSQAFARIGCLRQSVIPGGDHSVLIGQAVTCGWGAARKTDQLTEFLRSGH